MEKYKIRQLRTGLEMIFEIYRVKDNAIVGSYPTLEEAEQDLEELEPPTKGD